MRRIPDPPVQTSQPRQLIAVLHTTALRFAGYHSW
jgi:hypothetical protein